MTKEVSSISVGDHVKYKNINCFVDKIVFNMLPLINLVDFDGNKLLVDINDLEIVNDV